jgi:hypothetical protein
MKSKVQVPARVQPAAVCCLWLAVLANRPPVAGPDTYNTTSDTPVEIEPMANDVDPDGDPVQFVNWLNQPALGTLNTLPGGRLRYTPSGSVGLDVLRYNITDGKLMATGVVDISVGKTHGIKRDV